MLKHPGLLPLATLGLAESGEKLPGEVAAQIKRIKSRVRRREVANAARMFARLRYNSGLINRILKESDMLDKSVVYRGIFQKGAQKGERRGL